MRHGMEIKTQTPPHSTLKRWNEGEMGRLGGVFLILIILLSAAPVQAIDYELYGYVKALPSLAYDREWEESYLDMLVHHRLNTRWYATSTLTAAVDIRNRLFWGDTVEETPHFADQLEDRGYLDLAHPLIEEGEMVLHSMIDRLWLDYYQNDLQVRIGRQRINWGLNLVWNPNDIFNAYSYFDFDYEERPGTDGVRIQYYTGIASSIELAAKLDDDSDEIISTSLIRLNRWYYDFQFFAGQYLDEQLVFGGGWAGDIMGGGFRGELSYYHPTKEDDRDYVVGSISGDFTFASSLYLHAEILYDERGTTGDAGRRKPLPDNQLTSARHSIFGEAAYQFTPLIRGTLASIFNPNDESMFINPSLTWSVGNNWELLLLTQLYRGERGTEFGDGGYLFFTRLKMSY